LVDALLVQLRVHGSFDADRNGIYARDRVRTAQRAFRPTGWQLSDDGYLGAAGAIDLTTCGREALEEQVGRLRRATDDPGQLLGSAKDLLESVAKFVLEEFGVPTKKHCGVHAREPGPGDGARSVDPGGTYSGQRCRAPSP
jgi:hypothetical protein